MPPAARVAPVVADTDGDVRAIAMSGTTVFLGGAFTVVNRLDAQRPRRGQRTTGALKTASNPGPDGQVNALAVRNSTLYVGGSFANVAGQPRRNFAAVDTATGALGRLAAQRHHHRAATPDPSTRSRSAARRCSSAVRFNGPLSQTSLVAFDLDTRAT